LANDWERLWVARNKAYIKSWRRSTTLHARYRAAGKNGTGAFGSKPGVRAVAHRLAAGMLAPAEKGLAGLARRVTHGRKARSLVRTVAERLIGATAASAPKVRLPGFDGDRIRAFLGNFGFVHDAFKGPLGRLN
jgi:hypothetical protein